jgi:DNA polymerase
VLREGIATPVQWNGRWLVPLYHPGARALIHRPFALQAEDYRRLARFVVSLEPAFTISSLAPHAVRPVSTTRR